MAQVFGLGSAKQLRSEHSLARVHQREVNVLHTKRSICPNSGI
jgi:hypothetical protein